MNATQVTIEPGDPRTPGATALLTASHELMNALFPAESNHYLSIDALCEPQVLFLVAKLDGEIAGCGGLALKDGYGEIKSMFVDPAKRGARIGAKLLDRLELEAKAHGLPCLRLETGDKLIAAHKLYEKQGFVRCDPFGDYPDDPFSVFMEKQI